MIIESKFISLLAGTLKEVTGLSEREVRELAKYFMAPDGQVNYQNFCQVLDQNSKDLG